LPRATIVRPTLDQAPTRVLALGVLPAARYKSTLLAATTTNKKVLCLNEGLVSNVELLELLRQRTQVPGHLSRYPQPYDPFPMNFR